MEIFDGDFGGSGSEVVAEVGGWLDGGVDVGGVFAFVVEDFADCVEEVDDAVFEINA